MDSDREIYSVASGYGAAREVLQSVLQPRIDETVQQLLTPWPEQAWVEALTGDYAALIQTLRPDLENATPKGRDSTGVVTELQYKLCIESGPLVWDLLSSGVYVGLHAAREAKASVHLEQAEQRWQLVVRDFGRRAPRVTAQLSKEQRTVEAWKRSTQLAATLLLEARADLTVKAREAGFAVQELRRQVVGAATAAASASAEVRPAASLGRGADSGPTVRADAAADMAADVANPSRSSVLVTAHTELELLKTEVLQARADAARDRRTLERHMADMQSTAARQLALETASELSRKQDEARARAQDEAQAREAKLAQAYADVASGVSSSAATDDLTAASRGSSSSAPPTAGGVPAGAAAARALAEMEMPSQCPTTAAAGLSAKDAVREAGYEAEAARQELRRERMEHHRRVTELEAQLQQLRQAAVRHRLQLEASQEVEREAVQDAGSTHKAAVEAAARATEAAQRQARAKVNEAAQAQAEAEAKLAETQQFLQAERATTAAAQAQVQLLRAKLHEKETEKENRGGAGEGSLGEGTPPGGGGGAGAEASGQARFVSEKGILERSHEALQRRVQALEREVSEARLQAEAAALQRRHEAVAERGAYGDQHRASLHAVESRHSQVVAELRTQLERLQTDVEKQRSAKEELSRNQQQIKLEADTQRMLLEAQMNCLQGKLEEKGMEAASLRSQLTEAGVQQLMAWREA